MNAVVLDEAPLALTELWRVAQGHVQLVLGEVAQARIRDGHRLLIERIEAGQPIYGVTTGLGAAVDTARDHTDADFQRYIPLGRAAGVGRVANRAEVRAILLARLAGIAQGRSGMSPALVATLLSLLNRGVHPEIPLTGSLGESDLAPLAHVGLALLGKGWVEYRGTRYPASEVARRLELPSPAFAGKDGLALVSANAASVGLAALMLGEARQALGGMLAALAMTCEGLRANLSPFQPQVVSLRPVPQQAEQASSLLRLLEGGALTRPGPARRLQDPLSVRCGVAVHAAAADAWQHVYRLVNIELAGAGDNPALIAEHALLAPTANFDSTHLALACEGLGLALARLAACSAERVSTFMSCASTGLPRFLGRQPGQAGLVSLQRTAAALLAEIGQLANPLPAYCMPVAERVENYSGQALACVEKTRALCEKLRLLAAVELLVAAQAIDLHGALELGQGTGQLHASLREQVATLYQDRPLAADIEATRHWLGSAHVNTLLGNAL